MIAINIESDYKNKRSLCGGQSGRDDRVKRIYKGKSLIEFPTDYVLIDLETTGLDPSYDSIIEIGAIKVHDNQIVERMSILTRPKYIILLDEEDINDADDYLTNDQGEAFQYINDFIKDLTGITNKMLFEEGIELEEGLAKLSKLVDNSIIVGHNVNFDVNFLYDAYLKQNIAFSNDYIDTMRISRRLHPEDRHHRLKDLAIRYDIDYSKAHRAVEDCEITMQVFCNMKLEVLEQYATLDDFINICNKRKYGLSIHAKDIITKNSSFNPENPFYEKVVVFTGTLTKLTRKEAMQIIADIGGINADGVNKKTNFLILGTQDYRVVKGGKSTKQKKAEKLKLDGNDIEVISEDVFYSMLEDSAISNCDVSNIDEEN